MDLNEHLTDTPYFLANEAIYKWEKPITGNSALFLQLKVKYCIFKNDYVGN